MRAPDALRSEKRHGHVSHDPDSGVARRSLSRLAGIAVAALFLAHALFLACVADDAYISFRFGRNLAAGNGWVWNAGEPPVEGFTSPLWVLFGALCFKLGLDPARPAQVAGILASLASLAITYRFGRRHLGLSPLAAWWPPLFLALSGPFATWGASGMETSLFGTLLLGSLHLHLSGADGRGGSRSVAYLLLVLATLVRPEGLLLFAVLAALDFAGPRGHPRRSARRIMAPWLLYLVPFALYFAWRYGEFGFPLPNTFYAKAGLSAFIVLRGMVYTAYFVIHYLVPWLPLALLLAWERGGPSIRNAFAVLRHPEQHRETLPWVWMLALLAVYGLYVIGVGGDYMAMDRFFVPVLPLVYLPIGWMAARLLAGLDGAPARRALAASSLMLGAGVTLLHSTPADALIFSKPRGQQGLFEGVENERLSVIRFTSVGRFFDARKHSRDEMLASPVVGAIGYFADMKILDMLGLTDVHIAHAAPREPLGLGFPGHERSDPLYVARRRPTYVFLRLVDVREAPRFPDWGGEANRILHHLYTLEEARIIDSKGTPRWLYFLELERGRGAGAEPRAVDRKAARERRRR